MTFAYVGFAVIRIVVFVPFLLSALGCAPVTPSDPATKAAANSHDWPYPNDVPRPPVTASPSLAGAEPADVTRYLMVRGAGQPALSPDGQTVAFKISTTGQPQLWTVPSTGGWPRQLTFGRGITFHTWGPKNAGLIYGADRDGDEREGYRRISPAGTTETVVRPYSDAFVAFGGFSSDGKRIVYSTTERNGADFDVRALDLETRVSTEVLRGRFGFFAKHWQPNGPWIIVSESRGEDANDVHLVNVQTKEKKTILKPKDRSSYTGFSWRPDGESFYLATNQDRDFAALARYDLDSAKLTLLSTPDADVEDVSLSGDGRYLAWTTNEGGYSRLHVVPANPLDLSKSLAPADLPKGVVTDLAWASEAPVLAIALSGPSIPGDVWTFNADERVLSRATHSTTAGLDLERTAVQPVSHFFEARDGVRLHGLLYRPPGDEPTPVVLRVHGGPTAQARPVFRGVIQYLVSHGISVFDFNYRGSSGFGKRFGRLNDLRLRANELNDLADAVGWLRQQPGLQAIKVAIMGGSYGGYLTNAALGAFPDMFSAGVSFVGVSDWIRALEGASPALKASDRFEFGDIEDPEDRAFLAGLSPLNNAKMIRSPLMVLHGANDPRDPVSESDNFVAAIRANGVDVAYLRFPDEGHGIRKLSNRVYAYRQVVAFLEKHLGIAKSVDPQ